jgi:aspartyl-tRNA(Asn)/glutamyl-tRNA(Gln) amidotransferase subunit C
MISRDDVKKLARLARIEVSDRDVDRMQHEIGRVFELIGQMLRVDTTNVAPMTHALALSQRLRDDEVIERDQREELQAIAPAVEDGLYLVPKVLE